MGWGGEVGSELTICQYHISGYKYTKTYNSYLYQQQKSLLNLKISISIASNKQDQKILVVNAISLIIRHQPFNNKGSGGGGGERTSII